MRRFLVAAIAAASLLVLADRAAATIGYTPVVLPPGAIPAVGPGLMTPAGVFGKEYSHDIDESTAGAGGVADPEQVIAWDGIGGTADGLDYSGTRAAYLPDDEVDAIANHLDALFVPLLQDRSHLIFSHDDMISGYPGPPPLPAGAAFFPVPIPPAGPIPLSGGTVIGGAGELSFELAGTYHPASTHGTWATQPTINGMPLPRDVDGVEVWGPEPAFTADADKYSLQVDAFSATVGGPPATSVWNLAGTPYISHTAIVAAVTSLLGPLPPGVVLPYPDFIDGDAAINVDALMVNDVFGNMDTFDRDPAGGPGDRIIFSIRQIMDPTDPDGYYATGSELFVLDATFGAAGTTYLSHGGHLWDHAYALSSLAVAPGGPVNGYAVIDINAIEAVGALLVPEPASCLLLTLACSAAAVARRRKL